MLSIPWKDTRKHQTNLSPSKSSYPFPKDKRFKDKHNALCDSFYNIPSSLGKAPSSGIGRGNKVQMINASVMTPSPLNYQIKSQFQANKNGVKFGLGRENIKYNGIFNKSQTPQPGHYQISNSLPTKRAMQQPSSSKNPGPAHYKTIQSLNNSGRYVLSQLTNCPGYKIKKVKKYEAINSNPGPGQYQTNLENINKMGLYCNSKHENSRCRTFSRSMKGLITKKEIPGPGSYNYYSEFGAKV